VAERPDNAETRCLEEELEAEGRAEAMEIAFFEELEFREGLETEEEAEAEGG
jgi:hypothetical protein